MTLFMGFNCISIVVFVALLPWYANSLSNGAGYIVAFIAAVAAVALQVNARDCCGCWVVE